MTDKENASGYNVGESSTRPWGSWRVIEVSPHHVVKHIEINPGASLSLQFHNHRSEHWIITQGVCQATIGEGTTDYGAGQHIYIPQGAIHRARNNGQIPLHLVEIQQGDRLYESDIVRLQDDYHRTDEA